MSKDERPTTDNPEAMTGWIAYYICDRSGIGYSKPRYIKTDVTDRYELKEYIIDGPENWASHGCSYSLTIHLGVIPPKEVIEAQLAEKRERVAGIQRYVDEMKQDLERFYHE